MKSYGQFCPVAKAAELFCERWTPLIVRDLASGPLRFSELQRGDLSLPDATAAGRLEVLGSRKLARALWAWLNLSPLASVVSQRDRQGAMVAAGG